MQHQVHGLTSQVNAAPELVREVDAYAGYLLLLLDGDVDALAWRNLDG